MKRTDGIRVRYCDLGAEGCARASAVYEYLSDFAPLSVKEAAKTEGSCSLVRFSMGVYTDLFGGEELTLEAYTGGSGDGSVNRCARLYKSNGTVAAEINSVWLSADGAARKSALSADGDAAYISLDVPGRINIPKDMRLSLVGERSVSHGDMDMSHTRRVSQYPDMLWDHVPQRDAKRILNLSLCFFGRCGKGETEKIYCGSIEEDIYYFRTVKKSGETVAEARLTVETVL